MPMASAPSWAASTASAGVVMPQILMRTAMPPFYVYQSRDRKGVGWPRSLTVAALIAADDPALHHLDLAVIVAVIAVRMVQVTLDEVVRVIAVRDRFVAAAGAVRVVLGVGAAVVLRRAAGRIRAAEARLRRPRQG